MEIQQAIMRQCDIVTLFALMHDRYFESLAREEIERWYKQVLSKFTPDPEGLRGMMRDTGAVISGSTALWFLTREPERWVPEDLDIITGRDKFREVVEYVKGMLKDPRVTTLTHKSNHDYYPVAAYEGRVQIEAGAIRIEVLQARVQSPFYAIPFYWSTHLMNAIAADAVVCGYPELTLRKVGIMRHNDDFSIFGPTEATYKKYTRRGFKLYDDGRRVVDTTGGCRGYIGCGQRDRIFGDGWTMVIPTGQQTVMEAAETMRGKEVTAWRLGGGACGNGECFGRRYQMVIATMEWEDEEGRAEDYSE